MVRACRGHNLSCVSNAVCLREKHLRRQYSHNSVSYSLQLLVFNAPMMDETATRHCFSPLQSPIHNILSVFGKRRGFGSKFSISATWEGIGITKPLSRRFHRYRGRLCVLHFQNHFYAPQVPASADMRHDIDIIQTSRFVASSRTRFVGFTTSQFNRRVVQLP